MEEEATAEPTEEMEEEATAEPTEEMMEEEATAEPTEEMMEEEATAEPTEEATEEPEEEALSPEAEAGKYLVTISRGCGCHFNRDLQAMAGGAFAFHPGGDTVSIWPANITPDEATGIGSWTADEVAVALRTGATPDGQLHPIMPYKAFSFLSDEDALNIAAYLFALDPIENEVPAREVPEEPEPYTPASPSPATAPTDPIERGEYLVKLARCGDCHTPRNEDGTQNMDMFLAGNRMNEDEVAWNITPDDATGIGTLSEEEIANFLRTGKLADGSEVVGAMGNAIDSYFSQLTEDDAAAIAAFLKSIPAVENDPE